MVSRLIRALAILVVAVAAFAVTQSGDGNDHVQVVTPSTVTPPAEPVHADRPGRLAAGRKGMTSASGSASSSRITAGARTTSSRICCYIPAPEPASTGQSI